MANIKMLLGGSWVELPNGRYTLGQTEEHRQYTMASGRVKTVLTGVRKTITASMSYVPQATLTALNNAINDNPIIDVKFFDVDGTELTEAFICEAISPTVFKYVTRGGQTVPVWTDVSISLKGQVIS